MDRERAFYDYYSQDEANGLGIAQGYYLKPEFIRGIYDAETKQFIENEGYYEALDQEQQEQIMEELKENYIKKIKETGMTLSEHREIAEVFGVESPLSYEEILKYDNPIVDKVEKNRYNINEVLINQKVTIPNGRQISANQYIQEFVAQHIPESGTFKLKSGAEISARQYIEEFVLGEGQTKYHGDIEALINDTVEIDEIPPERGTDGNEGPEVGMSQTQVRYFNDEEGKEDRDEEGQEEQPRKSESFRDSLKKQNEPTKSNSFRDSLEPKTKNAISRDLGQGMKMQRNALRVGKEAVMGEQTAITVEQQQLKQKQTKSYGMSL